MTRSLVMYISQVDESHIMISFSSLLICIGLFSLVLRRRKPPYTRGVMLGRLVSLLKYDVMKCYVSTIVHMVCILFTSNVVRFEHWIV
jgi:hypothetical protein